MGATIEDVGKDGMWYARQPLWSMQRYNNPTTTASGYVSYFSFSPPGDHRVGRPESTLGSFWLSSQLVVS